MNGKTIVITGATSGLGEAAALAFASEGASVVAVGRDRERGEHVLAAMRERHPGGAHAFEQADLTLLSGVRGLAERVAAKGSKLDVLINCAGGTFGKRVETADGLELTFALNVMAPFALTRALAAQLAGGSVVNVVTGVPSGMKLDPADLQLRKGYGGFGAYSKAKLALEMVTVEQSARMPELRVNCVHPGIIVGTRFGSGSMPAWLMATGAAVARLFRFSSTLEQAVERFRRAATTDQRGVFFAKDEVGDYPKQVGDATVRAAVWAELERLVTDVAMAA